MVGSSGVFRTNDLEQIDHPGTDNVVRCSKVLGMVIRSIRKSEEKHG